MFPAALEHSTLALYYISVFTILELSSTTAICKGEPNTPPPSLELALSSRRKMTEFILLFCIASPRGDKP